MKCLKRKHARLVLAVLWAFAAVMLLGLPMSMGWLEVPDFVEYGVMAAMVALGFAVPTLIRRFLRCPNCGKTYDLDPHWRPGTPTYCRRCGERIVYDDEV